MPATGVVDHARSPSHQRTAIETAETFPKGSGKENGREGLKSRQKGSFEKMVTLAITRKVGV